jgi:hypothetical protein
MLTALERQTLHRAAGNQLICVYWTSLMGMFRPDRTRRYPMLEIDIVKFNECTAGDRLWMLEQMGKEFV